MASPAQSVDAGRSPVIRTPDQRLRVFVSSTLQELAEERAAAKAAIARLRLAPVMFELGARPHPPRALYRAYLEQSHIFIGIYWQRYGWVAPGETISGLEDEYRLSGNRPKLIYLKTPAPEREARLETLLERIRGDDQASYRPFTNAQELAELIENDLALLLTERFELAQPRAPARLETQRSHHLPIPPTPLIGRQRDVTAVQDLLRQDEVRLVTLSGPGGTGKTRLGLQVAAEVDDAFADGVSFIPLASISDPNLVVSTIAQTLGVSEAGQPPLLGTVKDYLAHKHLLLLLDNFEQVVAAAPVVSELLAACAKLKVLATSRERLHLSGERVYLVPPLALPLAHSPVETLSQCAAVELFVQRAQAVSPRFSLSPENAAAVVDICVRLDGLPLALELAAARIKLLSPQAMLKRLQHRLALLTGGTRDLPARQQTLRNAIHWSYDLLNHEETRLFERLSVFVGGFSLEAAEALAAGEGDLDVIMTLASLVDKSLVRQEEGQEANPRFIMLQTIQEFAQERLEASGEADASRRAHAEIFLALAEEAEPHLTGVEQVAWFESLEREQGNLRAALAWVAQSAEDAMGVRLAGALWRFWYARGHLSEGRDWMSRFTRAAARTAAQAKALHGAGVLAYEQGDNAQARPLFEASLALSRDLGDKQGMAFALNSLGIMAYEQGDYASARSLHEESLATRREAGDKRGAARSLVNLGNIFFDQGDYASARSLYTESLALSREMGDKGNVVNTLLNLGNLAHDEGDHVQAYALHEESLAISRELGDKGSLAHALSSLGNMFSDQGDYARARSLYEESLTIRRELGDKQGAAHSLLNLGIIAHEQHDYTSAHSLYRESLAILRELGDKWWVLYLLEAFAAIRVVEDEPEEAARLLGAAETLRKAIGAALPPPERPKYARNVEAARQKLDEERFEAAWLAGSKWSLEEAVVYALKETGTT